MIKQKVIETFNSLDGKRIKKYTDYFKFGGGSCVNHIQNMSEMTLIRT